MTYHVNVILPAGKSRKTPLSENPILSTLKLSHKGLILVSVPLVTSFIFVGILWTLLERADQEVAQESRAREASQLSGALGKNVFDAAQSVAAYSLTKNPAMSQRFDMLAAQTPRLYEDIRYLLGDDPQAKPIIDSIEVVHRRAMNVLTMARDAADERDLDAIHLRHLREHLQSCLEEVMRHMQSLGEEVKRQQAAVHGDSATTKQNVRWILALGLFANVLVSLSLAIYFSRGIASRLAIINENAHLFTQGKALNPALGGADEIAEMDKTFHQMAVALEEAAKKERELEKIKQEFVAMVSHDLRTPLTSLQGTLALLQRGAFGQLSDNGKIVLDKSEREMTRLIRLIGDLLSLEKFSAGKFDLSLSWTRLDEIIGAAIDAVQRIADANEIRIIYNPQNLSIHVDGARLIQVLVNLLSNALKFSPAHGQIEITVEQGAGFVKVWVKDQGRGVPEELRESIFERFKQVKTEDATEHQGTGLGLPICKAIVEQHGGQIGVEPIATGGSAFWFTLPNRPEAKCDE